MNNESLRRLHNAEIDGITYFRRFLVAITVTHGDVAVTLIKRPRPNAARCIDLFEPAEKSAEKDVVQNDCARNLDHQVAHIIVEVRIPHLIDDAIDYGVIGTQPCRIVNGEITPDRRGVDHFLIRDQDNVVVPGQRRKKIGAVISNARAFRREWRNESKTRTRNRARGDNGLSFGNAAHSFVERAFKSRIDVLFSLGPKTIRSRRAVGEKYFERSALKSL